MIRTLYRKAVCVPTLLCALLLSACDNPPPPKRVTAPTSNRFSEALQEAKAAQQSAERHVQDQQRIDQLLGRGQTPAR